MPSGVKYPILNVKSVSIADALYRLSCHQEHVFGADISINFNNDVSGLYKLVDSNVWTSFEWL